MQKFYEKLRAPRWLSLLAHNQLETWTAEQEIYETSETAPSLSSFTRSSRSGRAKYCFEMQDHLLLRWSKDRKLPHERISYSQFPIYEQRLRELRSYMDSQQPKGLRALWKDKRNSNTYYTFWFVVVFGSLSVLLGFCGLAVAIAQTWAQYQTLNN